jgi:pyruvate, water dikinase
MKYIKFFENICIDDILLVGGKNSSLGEMYSSLSEYDIKVPNGFAITCDAYWKLLETNDLKSKIESLLKRIDIKDTISLSILSKQIRKLVEDMQYPQSIIDEIFLAYKELSKFYGEKSIDVAVRSSATAEDLPDASFAGQQDTYLNISSKKQLIKAIKKCYASLFTDRAISYRQSRGYDHLSVALSIGVQKMVRSDKASSGVMFSIDTESGNDSVVLINSILGLGENIVGGTITPDEYYVFKPTLKKGFDTILKRQLGNKTHKMIYANGSECVKNIKTLKKEKNSFSLRDDEVIQLAKYALTIEEHYSKLSGTYRPMDIEWAKDAKDGELYIVQARPETVQSKKLCKQSNDKIQKYKMKSTCKKSDTLLTGRSIGDKINTGKTRFISSLKDAHLFEEGEILVADITDPDWEPLMKKSSALITNRGGRTCHAAIVARELGIPAVIGTKSATKVLSNPLDVTVCCAEGENGKVYSGKLDYEIEEIDVAQEVDTKTKIFMNVANPQKAFEFSKLPNQGVGLARMEFIINTMVKAHPMALYDMFQGKKVKEERQIKKLLKGFENPKDFFIKRLAEGIGTIAAAFYPKPVVVRTSDFKTNEYKYMLGGEVYEKDEENPMLGFRGASRYYDDSYRPAFEWECETLRLLRDEMGLDNIKVMLPFVRTPQEGKKVIKIMNSCGLVQGNNNLEIYAMCEIPSNVIIAEEFLKIFDGYSIGSNDLTQLTLGVDRDSAQISHIFDERNEAVMKMLSMAIQACKKEGKYIGICGQAPSDYPEITEFLIKEGISSISLNPDSILKTMNLVKSLEEKN